MAFKIPVELFLYYAQIRNYLSLGGYALLVYDHLLTLDDEIQHVWKTRPGLNKPTRSKVTTFFFYVARYVPLVVGVMFCWNFLYMGRPALSRDKTVTNIMNGLFLIGIAGSEAILLARTYGIWICSRRMLWFLTALYTCVLLVCVALLLPSLGGIKVIPGANANFIAYAMVIFIETIVIVLTLYRGILDYRATTQSGEVPLILAFSRTMYRDGLQYYVCILGCSLLNMILVMTNEGAPAFLADVQLVMHSVLSCRVVLRLRRMTHSLSAELGDGSNERSDNFELQESDPIFGARSENDPIFSRTTDLMHSSNQTHTTLSSASHLDEESGPAASKSPVSS